MTLISCYYYHPSKCLHIRFHFHILRSEGRAAEAWAPFKKVTLIIPPHIKVSHTIHLLFPFCYSSTPLFLSPVRK